MNNVIDITERKPVTLEPAMAQAINEEMADADAREIRLTLEIARLHGVIAGMRMNCEFAKVDCMHPHSCQALRLDRAIKLANDTIGPEEPPK